MSLAKVNREIISTYFKHQKYLDERILKAKAMMSACEIVKEYHAKRYSGSSITKDHCSPWKDPMEKMDKIEKEKFERYLLDELGVFGYEAEIQRPKEYSDEINLNINEELP